MQNDCGFKQVSQLYQHARAHTHITAYYAEHVLPPRLSHDASYRSKLVTN